MQTATSDQKRTAVRQVYGAIATERQSGCCGGPGCGCGGADASRQLGYTDQDLTSVPEGANLGLGCGNPQAIAALQPGERVLDLGSGAGFDAFLAARQVGPTGRVIGVDMTPEMVARATTNLGRTDLSHVDFRLGNIEQLPVEDASVDVIMSNCVINLSPDKAAVFREAFRALAPGGRLAISDIVAIGDLPAAIADDPTAYTGCVSGAVTVGELEQLISAAGFTHVRVDVQAASRTLIDGWTQEDDAGAVVASALIEAVKPKGAGACCDSVLLNACCPAEAKSSCCGSSAETASCGCGAGDAATAVG